MDDSLTKQTTWNQKETKFFWTVVKKLLDELRISANEFDPDNESILIDMFAMEMTDIDDLKREKDMSHLMAESLVQKWIEEDYLIMATGGRIMLGPRTLGEMNALLIDKYQLEVCKSCKLICFVGYRCNACDRSYHDECCGNPMKCNECKRDMGQLQLFI